MGKSRGSSQRVHRAHGNDLNIHALASRKVRGNNGTRSAKPKVEEDNNHCTCPHWA